MMRTSLRDRDGGGGDVCGRGITRQATMGWTRRKQATTGWTRRRACNDGNDKEEAGNNGADKEEVVMRRACDNGEDKEEAGKDKEEVDDCGDEEEMQTEVDWRLRLWVDSAGGDKLI